MDYNILIDHIQDILTYETFQWFYAALYSVIVLASMIINNLTTRKWLSLLFLTVLGTAFFMFSLNLLVVTIPDLSMDYYSAATVCIFSGTLSLSYSTARLGIMITTKPRKRAAAVLASILLYFSTITIKVANWMHKTSDKLIKYSTHVNVKRVENLVEKATQLKEEIAI